MRIDWLAAMGMVLVSYPCWAQIPAFSGADGPGATATGGRGGDVYHVTNLEFDLNGTIPGSLKYGLNTAPAGGRTIVFDVGGTIYHDGGGPGWWYRVGTSNITIAGQTAPGGITIAGVGSKWTGGNVILRNITIRPNKDPVSPSSYMYDSFALQVKNSIVDHVSATWYTDEGISLTDAGENSTVQYTTIGEGLNYAGHSYGSIISTEVNGTHYSFNHNLYAHNSSRMPRLGSETGATGAILDWTNNVVYNWQNKAGYSGTDQNSRSNLIGNYYIKGPNNGATVFDGGDDDARPGYTRIYQSKDTSLANKADTDKDGVLYDGIAFGPGDTMPNGQKYYAGNTTFVTTPFMIPGVGTPELADVALQRVLDYGGANWLNRHSIENRIIDSVKTGTGGLINDLTMGVQAGEWATVLAERPDAQGNAPFNRPAGFDTDQDGMPDTWETAHSLNPNVADNNGDFDTDGYTNLEEYINELGEWPAPQSIVFNASTNNRYAQITNWDIQWQPSKFDEAIIEDGTVVVDAVGQHAGTLKIGMDIISHAKLNITAGWLKVEDAGDGLSTGEVIIGADAGATAELNLRGGELSVQTLSKNTNSSFHFTGGILHADEVDFNLVNDGGSIAPGQSPGMTQIKGDLTINAGTLEIELGGTTPGVDFDLIEVTGDATLAGVLDVSLLRGFVLSPNTTFKFLDITGTRTGQFTGLREGALVGNFGEDLYITYMAGDGNDVALTTTPIITGDFDGDGDIDGADFLIWQRGGSPNPLSSSDLAIWQTNFGDSVATAIGDAVPEPSSLALAMLLLMTTTAIRAWLDSFTNFL